MLPKTDEGQTKCPIEAHIFWKHESTDKVSTVKVEPNGFIRNPESRRWDSKDSFRLKFIVHNTELCQISSPFTVSKNGGVQTINEVPVCFNNGNVKTFYKEVKVRERKNYKTSAERYYSNNCDNEVFFAAVKSNRLIVIAAGIASQKGHFFYTKMRKYDVGLYKFRNKIVIPELPQWTALPKFLEAMVDVSALPKRAEFKPSMEDTLPVPEDGKAVVKWSDPFSGKIALIAKQGEILCPVEEIRNHGKDLTNPKRGTEVVLGYTVPPIPGSTAFVAVAKAVYL